MLFSVLSVSLVSRGPDSTRPLTTARLPLPRFVRVGEPQRILAPTGLLE